MFYQLLAAFQYQEKNGGGSLPGGMVLPTDWLPGGLTANDLHIVSQQGGITTIDGIDDVVNFRRTVFSMEKVGFSKPEVKDILGNE